MYFFLSFPTASVVCTIFKSFLEAQRTKVVTDGCRFGCFGGTPLVTFQMGNEFNEKTLCHQVKAINAPPGSLFLQTYKIVNYNGLFFKLLETALHGSRTGASKASPVFAYNYNLLDT